MIEINRITTDELRGMEDKEGLVLQGCAEPFQEWMDGINDIFTEEGILKDGSRFEKAMAFEHDGLTNLLFPFEGVKLEKGKLAIWRLKTRDVFGGTWLSDYVPNRLGGFRLQEAQKKERPKMNLLGEDGNIYAIMGRASGMLKENGQDTEATEMIERVTSSGSYEEALGIISEYVETELSSAIDRIGPRTPNHKKTKDSQER